MKMWSEKAQKMAFPKQGQSLTKKHEIVATRNENEGNKYFTLG